MEQAIETFTKAPLSTLLVTAGILFWVLAIAGSLAGKITVEPQQQTTAAILGSVLLIAGIAINFVTPPVTPNGHATPVAPDGHVDEWASCGLSPRGREWPGFVCAEAKEPIEHLICADADLAYWNGELTRLYHEQLDQQKTPEDKSNLVTKEREWIKRRDEQCDIPNYNNLPPAKLCGKKDCILSQTKARAGELERH